MSEASSRQRRFWHRLSLQRVGLQLHSAVVNIHCTYHLQGHAPCCELDSSCKDGAAAWSQGQVCRNPSPQLQGRRHCLNTVLQVRLTAHCTAGAAVSAPHCEDGAAVSAPHCRDGAAASAPHCRDGTAASRSFLTQSMEPDLFLPRCCSAAASVWFGATKNYGFSDARQISSNNAAHASSHRLNLCGFFLMKISNFEIGMWFWGRSH